MEMKNKLKEWEGRADKLALALKMNIAVVEIGTGIYQLWPTTKCGNGIYIAEYKESGENVDSVD